MAEARVAVRPVPTLGAHRLRLNTQEHRLQIEVVDDQDGLLIFVPGPRHIAAAGFRMALHMYNMFKHAVWPCTPIQLALLSCGFVAYVGSRSSGAWVRSGSIADLVWRVDSKLLGWAPFGTNTRVYYLAAAAAVSFVGTITAAHRSAMKILLSYKGFLFEPPGRDKMTLKTKLWFGMLKFFSKGGSPSLYTYQGVLPALPVPKLSDTLSRFVASIEPVLPAKEFAEMKAMARDFETGEGKTWQRAVKLKYLATPNYVSDWWLRFVYLTPETPIFINSNFYGLESTVPPATKERCARLGRIIWEFAKAERRIASENWPPVVGEGIPLCMDQYKLAFRTSRIPGPIEDKLVQFPISRGRHVAILHKGAWYKLRLYTSRNVLLDPYEIQQLLLSIEQAAHCQKLVDGEDMLCSLTTMDRRKWSNVRRAHFSYGTNYISLSTIESAMFTVILDDITPTELSEECNALMHGFDGCRRWCDKTFNLVAFPNARIGLHVEHSWADAPVIGQIFESICQKDIENPSEYGVDGLLKPSKDFKGISGSPAERLTWEISSELLEVLKSAKEGALAAIKDLDLVTIEYSKYGKGFAKRCRVGPDSLIQMALQLAYYRDQGTCGLTYESAMTRMFLKGRTETIRSCTVASKEWVSKMDSIDIPDREKAALFRVAANQQQRIAKEACAGMGVDRHLFAMFVASRGFGHESKFLHKALTMQWMLSTSQVPQRQTGPWPSDPTGDIYKSPSGGFGPVTDNGYGVSYAMPGTKQFFFHVSSKVSSPFTNSGRMLGHIITALDDIERICLA